MEPVVPCRQIADDFAHAVPESSDLVEAFLEEWGDDPPEPGLVNLADSVLFPFLMAQLRVRIADDVLERTLTFIERLAAHPDWDVRDAIQVGVVNPLLDEPELAEFAEPFVGPSTRAMIDVGAGRVPGR